MKHKDAITVFDDAISRLKAENKPAIHEQIAKALINKGIALNNLGEYEAAITVYDEFIALFSGAHEPALNQLVSMALELKAKITGSAETPDQT